jgi:hypothetical protein
VVKKCENLNNYHKNSKLLMLISIASLSPKNGVPYRILDTEKNNHSRCDNPIMNFFDRKGAGEEIIRFLFFPWLMKKLLKFLLPIDIAAHERIGSILCNNFKWGMHRSKALQKNYMLILILIFTCIANVSRCIVIIIFGKSPTREA